MKIIFVSGEMFIHRKQKSAEAEIRCTKANHSAHTVNMCLLPVYCTELSATRSYMTNSSGVKAGVSQKIRG